MLVLALEVADTLKHCANDQRQGHGGIVKDFREAPAFLRWNKLAPGNGLGIGAATEPSPVNRLWTNAQTIVLSL